FRVWATKIWLGPTGPGTPCGPCGPVSPWDPCGPGGPCRPIGPCGPVWFQVSCVSFEPHVVTALSITRRVPPLLLKQPKITPFGAGIVARTRNTPAAISPTIAAAVQERLLNIRALLLRHHPCRGSIRSNIFDYHNFRSGLISLSSKNVLSRQSTNTVQTRSRATVKGTRILRWNREKLACSVGDSPTGERVRDPVAWVAFVEETNR